MALNTEPVRVVVVAGQKEWDASMTAIQRQMYKDIQKLENQLNKQLAPAFTKAGSAAEKAFRQSNQAATNLTFQLNDIGTSLAGGASPFMVMAQQGSQVAQVFQGLRNDGLSMGGALVSAVSQVLNPISLLSFAFIGLAGYAYQYFTTVEEGGDEAEKAIKKQEAALDAVISKYGDLVPMLKQVRDEQQAIKDAADLKEQTDLGIADVYKPVKEGFDSLQQSIGNTVQYLVELDNNIGVDSANELAYAWATAGHSLDAGTLSAKQLADVLTALQKADLLPGVDARKAIEFIQELQAKSEDAAISAKALRDQQSGLARGLQQLDTLTKSYTSSTKTQSEKIEEAKKKYADYLLTIRKTPNHYLELAVKGYKLLNAELDEINRSARVAANARRPDAGNDIYTEAMKELLAISEKLPDKLAEIADAKERAQSVATDKGMRDEAEAAAEMAVNTEKAADAAKEAEAQQKRYDDAIKDLQQAADGPLDAVEKVLKQHTIALKEAKTWADVYKASLLTINGLNQLATAGLQDMAKATASTSSDFAKIVGQIESGNKNLGLHGAGTVSGIYGFTDKTFINSMKMADPRLQTATNAQILAYKSSAEMQAKAFEALTADNARMLSDAGVELTDANRYLAHFLGAGGAIAAAKNPTLTANQLEAKGLLTSGSVSNNPVINGKTFAEMQAWASAQVEKARRQVAPTSTESSVDSINRETKSITAQTDAVHANTNAFDEATFKKEKAAKLQELLNKADEDGITVTKEMRDEFSKTADDYARAKAKEVGAANAAKAAESFEGQLQAIRDRTALLVAEASARGNLNAIIDQETYKVTKAKIIADLTNQAKAENIKLTTEQVAAIEAVAEANAKAEASQEGFANATKKTEDATKAMWGQLEGMTSSALSTFINDLRHGMDAGEAFAKMIDSIIGQLIDMAVQMLIVKPLFAAITSGIPGIGGAATSGQSGGVVGFTHGPAQNVNAGTFAGAPHFASGGMVGYDPNAVPIIAHRGEVIIPKSAMNRAAFQTRQSEGDKISVGPTSIQIDVANGGGTSTTNASNAQFAMMVDRSVQAVIVRESRPGGLLRMEPGRR